MTHEYDHSSDTGHRDRHPSSDSTLNTCWRGVRGLGALMLASTALMSATLDYGPDCSPLYSDKDKHQ